MYVRLWTLACVAAWTVAVLLSNPLVAEEPSAGWDRFEFVGNTAFSHEQLRRALIAEPDSLLATHPHSDRSTVRDVAQRLLVVGYTANDQGNDRFEITDAHGDDIGITKMAIRMVGKYGLRCAPELFADGTWPMSVLREACLVMVERGKYSGSMLNELQADDSNGPLCDASVAYLLSLAKQPVASKFAQRSLERLSPASFQSDREVLMSGPSGQWIAKVVAACESLSDDEIESLHSIGLSHQIVSGLYAIRKQTDDVAGGYGYDVAKNGLEGVLGGIMRR